MTFFLSSCGLLVISRTLDDASHYDTNTEINTSRYTCHECAHKGIINMLKILVMCEKMHMVLVVVLDGLSQHSYPNPAFQARTGFRHLCWDKPISHSNQCHMHIFFRDGRNYGWLCRYGTCWFFIRDWFWWRCHYCDAGVCLFVDTTTA